METFGSRFCYRSSIDVVAMKRIVKAVIITLLVVGAVTLAVMYVRERKLSTLLEQQIEHQGVVIDSLLNRRMQYVDVELWVTDKSKNVIYGRYNKGNITMPQERRYILVIDSVNSKIMYDKENKK